MSKFSILTNVNATNTNFLTREEKIKMYDECRKRTYQNEKLKQIIEDIYNMFEFDFEHHLSFNYDDDDTRKIKYINNILQPLYDVIETNNIPLFHKILYEILHPSNNTICTNAIFDIMNLLLYPYEYLNQENHYFEIITDYFLAENKYDFYVENSNYLYFYYLAKLIELHKSTEINSKSIECLIILYFLQNNIDPDKFIPAINYLMANQEFINSYYILNRLRKTHDESIKILLDIIINKKPARAIIK